MTIDLEDVLASHGPDDPARFIAIADHFLTAEDPHAAAAALDRAYGLAPDDADLARHRAAILDQLAVHEHGLVWRYVPAGTFLMGSETGDPDERPVHPRRLPAFWITDTPITWHQHCALLGWSEPPEGWPPEGTDLTRDEQFDIAQAHKIRRQYCGTPLMDPKEWQAHIEQSFTGEGLPPKIPVPGRFDRAPVVAVPVRETERLTARLQAAAVRYALPTEAQWEKAARGGLVGRRYSWGDAPPTRERCDFDRMGDYRLHDPRELPPNGYGLFGMCGGVSEWTADIYDALAYHRARTGDLSPPAPPEAEELGVLRGGCWTDCADAVTVSYRTAYRTDRAASPTIGFRLVRMTA